MESDQASPTTNHGELCEPESSMCANTKSDDSGMAMNSIQPSEIRPENDHQCAVPESLWSIPPTTPEPCPADHSIHECAVLEDEEFPPITATVKGQAQGQVDHAPEDAAELEKPQIPSVPDPIEIESRPTGHFKTSVVNFNVAGSSDPDIDAGDAYEAALENINLADSLMATCNNELLLDKLDTSIVMFRNAYDVLPVTNLRRSDAKRDLAYALGVRYMYTGQMDDCIEWITLVYDILADFTGGCQNPPEGQNDLNVVYSIDDSSHVSAKEFLLMAQQLLEEFHTSHDSDVINEAIDLLNSSLDALDEAETQHTRSKASIGLAKAYYTRFHISKNSSDLTKAISILQDVVRTCPMGDLLDIDPRANYHLGIILFEQDRVGGHAGAMEALIHYFQTFSSHIDDTETPSTSTDSTHPLEIDLWGGGVNDHVQSAYSSVGTDQRLEDAASQKSWNITPEELRNIAKTNSKQLDTDHGSGKNKLDYPENIDGTIFEFTAEATPEAKQRGSPMIMNFNSITEDKLSQDIKNAGLQLRTCKCQLSLANLETILFLFREVVRLTPTTHPLYTDASSDLMHALVIKCLHTGDIESAKEANELLCNKFGTIELDMLNREGVPHTHVHVTIGEAEYDRTTIQEITILANELLADFYKLISISTLDSVISCLQDAADYVLCMQSEHPLGKVALLNFVNALFLRFEKSHNMCDLTTAYSFAIKAFEKYGKDRTDRDYISICCLHLWMVHASITKTLHAPESLIWLFQGPHESMTDIFDTASTTGQDSNRSDNISNDRSHRITQYRKTILSDKIPTTTHEYCITITNLANTLVDEFKNGSQRPSDLDEAIILFRHALDLTPTSHLQYPEIMHWNSSALFARFGRDNQESDFLEAISLGRQALDLTSPLTYRGRWGHIKSLVEQIIIQDSLRKNDNNLDEAIELCRKALLTVPAGSKSQANILANLANALLLRINRKTGYESDMTDAIEHMRHHLELTPESDPLRQGSVSFLADMLFIRGQRGGQQSDLHESFLLRRSILDTTSSSDHHSRFTQLANLADLYSDQFLVNQKEEDINQAIQYSRECLLELGHLPSHPEEWKALTLLSNILGINYTFRGQINDLEESIRLARQAVKLTDPSHPCRRRETLINLQLALGRGNRPIHHLEEEIALLREVLSLPSVDPDGLDSFDDSPVWLALSKSYFALSELKQGDQKYLYVEEGMKALRTAANLPSGYGYNIRFNLAVAWAKEAYKNQHSSVFEAYDTALQLLPRLLPHGLNIHARHEVLTGQRVSEGIAQEGARCAIQHGLLDKAIEYLETGRAVFWNQVLRLRPWRYDQLRNEHPDLADELQTLSSQLDLASHRNTFADPFDNKHKLAIDKESNRLARLDEKWSKVVENVRSISGFEDFLTPRRFLSLQTAASISPVVILIANDSGSDCIIMTSNETHHIPFPELSTAILRILVQFLQLAAVHSHFDLPRSSMDNEASLAMAKLLSMWRDDEEDRLIGRRHGQAGPIPSNDIFLDILNLLWEKVVQPVLERLDIKISADRPRIQWCPTGLFTFLPIHAAGCYDSRTGVEECASDYIISSYTPTIEALLAPDGPDTQDQFKMVAVFHHQLYFAGKELDNIKARVPAKKLVQIGTPNSNSPACAEDVISHLPTASIAHFACHGQQDRKTPLNSALHVGEGQLTIAEIMKHRVPNGALAFLCACETAMGDEKLPDEAMSIGASLLFSGFRSVVATMWRMADEDGPTIADTFYEELFKGPDGNHALQPDVSKSALALDIAVQKLRRSGVEFRRWVPFIHLGK